MAYGTFRLAAIASLEYAILNLVLVFVDPFEEAVDAIPFPLTMPEKIFFFISQFDIWLVNWKFVLRCNFNQIFERLSHLLSSPTLYSSLID